jgi:acetyl esterase/lipase
MRKFLPLAGIGCVAILVLALIVGGAIMLVHGIDGSLKKNEKTKSALPGKSFATIQPKNLLESRQTFSTQYLRAGFARRKALEIPANSRFEVVEYPSGPVKLAAFQTRLDKEAAPQSAVIWVHPGFDGLQSADLEIAERFAESGFFVFCPSFRGEHKNPLKQECFFGEVNDLLGAIHYVRQLPHIDPERIYLLGENEGATLTLLTMTSGTKSIRAAFALGGWVSMDPTRFSLVTKDRADDRAYQDSSGESTRIDSPDVFLNRMEGTSTIATTRWDQELRFRSAICFMDAVKSPVFYFTNDRADLIQQQVDSFRVPIEVLPTSVLPQPGKENSASSKSEALTLVQLIEDKLIQDCGKERSIWFSADERQWLETRSGR